MNQTPTVPEKVWFTYSEAEGYTGLERTSMWKAVRRGTLRAGGVGRAIRFEKRELDRWMRGDEAR